MSSKPYKEVIRESIIRLGGKAVIFEIYDFVEKNYSDFIKGKEEKTWKNTIKYTLCRGDFYQGDNYRYRGGYKYWYINSSIPDQTQEETLQKKFEDALKWIHSDKEYQEMMLDYYLEF